MERAQIVASVLVHQHPTYCWQFCSNCALCLKNRTVCTEALVRLIIVIVVVTVKVIMTVVVEKVKVIMTSFGS